MESYWQGRRPSRFHLSSIQGIKLYPQFENKTSFVCFFLFVGFLFQIHHRFLNFMTIWQDYNNFFKNLQYCCNFVLVIKFRIWGSNTELVFLLFVLITYWFVCLFVCYFILCIFCKILLLFLKSCLLCCASKNGMRI